jgi:integrase
MGHESSKTTETIYGHWLDNKEKNDEIANKIAEIF